MALTFVSAAPSIVSELPFAAAVPTVKSCPSRFHVVLPSTVTVLFDEPEPTTTAPPLRRLALVMVIVLFRPPAAPMVIAPFDTTLPTDPPSIL
ncbi:MAG: hypothetical protein PCFJNLEI_04157 [Verrucomicrobiae bacterium]|nr:hypothetical protein [Verrucomicrobiae bacterium]